MAATIEFRQTTFSDLGIKEPDKQIGLTDKTLYIGAVARTPASTTYWAVTDHLYTGDELGELLDSTAPVKVDRKYQSPTGVISGDTAMPEAVKDVPKRGDYQIVDYRYFYQEHINSSIIGPVFAEYATNHNSRWDAAIKIGEVHKLIRDYARQVLQFINSEDLAAKTYREKMAQLDAMSKGSFPLDDIDIRRELATMGRIFTYYPGKEIFLDYLSAQSDLQNMDSETLERQAFNLPNDRRVTLFKGYLERMSKREQKDFALNSAVEEMNVMIDWEKRKVWMTHSASWPMVAGIGISFESETVGILKVRGKSVPFTVAYDVSADGEKIYHVEELKLPKSTNFLYGLWAWEKDAKGSRRFLSQQEALSLVPDEFPNREYLDVFFGRTQAAYLSPGVISHWPSEMSLVENGKMQTIRGAQVPVWVSVDTDYYPHARQLLSDENPLWEKLETAAQ